MEYCIYVLDDKPNQKWILFDCPVRFLFFILFLLIELN
jgi:hypothetical protein